MLSGAPDGVKQLGGSVQHDNLMLVDQLNNPHWTVLFLLPRNAITERVIASFMPQLLLALILVIGGALANIVLWRRFVAPTTETLSDPWMVILALNIVMIIVGTFLDLPAAVLLLGPLFVTIANAIGLDLVQLGLMMVVNLAVGLYTPPVGTTLFISAAIANVGIGSVVRSLLPFYMVSIIVLLLISYVPFLTIY